MARWYEATYTGDLSPFYQLLVHHWQQAEALEPTVDYLEKAGTQALDRGVFAVARDNFAELLRMSDPTDPNTPALLRTPAIQQRRPWWTSKLGQAYFGLGQLRESRRYCEAAIASFDRAMPTNTARAVGAFLGQVARQALYRCLPRWFVYPAQNEAERAGVLEASLLYRHLNTIYLSANESAINLYTSVRRLNVAERAGLSSQLVEAYAVMGYVCSAFHLYSLAERYYAKAQQTDQQIGDPLALAYALNASSLARLAIGHWQKIREELVESIAIYHRFGAWQGWGDAMATLITAERMSGNLARSLELSENLLQVARQNDNILHQIWGIGGLNSAMLRLGRPQEALATQQMLRPLLAQTVEMVMQIGGDALWAEVEIMQGNLALAEQYAMRFLQQMAQSSVPTAIHSYGNFFSISRILLILWASTPTNRELKTKTQEAVKLLRTYALLFPVGRPGLQLCQGWIAWINGKPKAAYAAWRKSIATAQKFAMSYEEGLAEYALGKSTAGGTGALHLVNAIAIFERLDANYDLALARQAAENAAENRAHV